MGKKIYLTEDSLKNIIRKVLNEAAYTPERAFKEGIKITIAEDENECSIIATLDDEQVGEISISNMRDKNRGGNCLGAYEVTNSSSDIDGLGPLLYDVAMEFSGDKGIMSDRTIVSDAARRVWDHYIKYRPDDVQTSQLDCNPGILTPNYIEDDCSQISAKKYDKDKWFDSSLSKVYKKINRNTISKLKELGILEIL